MLSLLPMNLELGRGAYGNFEQAVSYEWLIANAIGGFACGTVAEANTRRYHGLLIAALNPPTNRVLLVSKLDVSASYLNRRYDLFSNEFADGTVAPKGFALLESFRLDQCLPVWRYAIADALIEKRVVMQPGSNTTLVTIEILRASADISFDLTPLCTYRDYHGLDYGGLRPEIHQIHGGFEAIAFPGARSYRVVCDRGDFTPDFVWYRHVKYRLETQRGLDDTEDLFRPGLFHLTLAEGERATVLLTDLLTSTVDYERAVRQIRNDRQQWLQALPSDVPKWIEQLALAAEQFIVERRIEGNPAGKTVIAGYPWFTDWGRDTMIALPGLTLALGHFATAADILRTFAGYVSAGMIPNRFPDRDSRPEYNTVDATLWFIHALDRYTHACGDAALATEMFPVLVDIIAWHRRGTRYGIRVDTEDGLLTAGEAGMQLTWMDAKVDDWVVTPRSGKCVEINALWYNALSVMEGLAARAERADLAEEYRRSAQRVKDGFRRFWNADRQCLFDVIHGEQGELSGDGRLYDGRLRPNQLLAVSLPHSPLDEPQQKSVVDLCARELLTSYGLRSLADGDPNYASRYQGDRRTRDGAYHQGTVWAWLIGPFVDAHYRVYRDRKRALSFLEPFRQHLNEGCLGQIGEIFDATPPFAPRGCFAQAWSVAEVLRVWLRLGSGNRT